MVAQVGYSVAGWSRGRVALCAVCTVHVKMRSAHFLVKPQNQGRRFVSDLASKQLGQFSPVWPQNRWLRFSDLGLKTGSYGLVIYALKLPWRFFSLGIKTKRASVCRLRHKTDWGRTPRDMHWDLAACFAWKQVTLGFLSLTLRPTEAQQRVVHMATSRRLHQDQVKNRWVDTMGASDLTILTLSFSMY
jgi:hypothetical protein